MRATPDRNASTSPRRRPATYPASHRPALFRLCSARYRTRTAHRRAPCRDGEARTAAEAEAPPGCRTAPRHCFPFRRSTRSWCRPRSQTRTHPGRAGPHLACPSRPEPHDLAVFLEGYSLLTNEPRQLFDQPGEDCGDSRVQLLGRLGDCHSAPFVALQLGNGAAHRTVPAVSLEGRAVCPIYASSWRKSSRVAGGAPGAHFEPPVASAEGESKGRTAQTRTCSPTPFSVCFPRSSKLTPADVRASVRTTSDTSTSPGADSPLMREAMLTAPP